jgi:predicted nucleotidyltransferase
MNLSNPNLPLLELVAAALGPLRERLVLVGGCATGLFITDSGAPPVRTTRDVDVVVEAISIPKYQAFERELKAAGFQRDRSPDAPICRWVVGQALMDVVPVDASVLGFGNRWYSEAVRSAQLIDLPSGNSIRLISPPVFIGTKLEALRDRGTGDLRASHDLEDIVSVIDGRPEIVTEVQDCIPELREYLSRELAALLDHTYIEDVLAGHLPGDEESQARLPLLIARMRELVKAQLTPANA